MVAIKTRILETKKLLAASIIVGFWPFIQSMIKRWDNEDSNYCFLVVPLFLYLCWENIYSSNFPSSVSVIMRAVFAAMGGTALGSRVVYTVIDTIQKEHLVENAAKMGSYIVEQLTQVLKR